MATTSEPERDEPAAASSEAQAEPPSRSPRKGPEQSEASSRRERDPQPAELEVRPPTRLELAWYRVVWSIVWPPGWLLWRPTVVGRENLPQTTPYIISPVHRSNIDTFLTARITERRVRFMAKEGVFSVNWIARVFSSLGSFPVRRGTPDRVALQICERALAAGEPVVLFPEGTRRSPRLSKSCRGDRRLSPFAPTSPSCRSASAGASAPCLWVRRGSAPQKSPWSSGGRFGHLLPRVWAVSPSVQLTS